MSTTTTTTTTKTTTTTGKSFESKLTSASSAEAVKLAKQLLKSGALFGVARDREGWIHGVFQEKSHCTELAVRPGEPPQFRCDCGGGPNGKLCEHAAALLMYCGRFKGVLSPLDDASQVKYAGLRFENLAALAGRAPEKPTAHLTIATKSEFLHAPSKEEKAYFDIRLHTAGRDYLGNLANVRQLYFNKVLLAVLKFDQFSLHDQQILRFMAGNGEAESSMIVLKSETAAEFFHSLIDFEEFYWEDRKLFFRAERGEPVLIRDARRMLIPGIRVGDSLLPVGNARVIAGRSGCWIGCHGEYYFVPATLEVGWLRNFFRNNPIPESQRPGPWPVPILDGDGAEPARAPLRILLGLAPGTEPDEFRLRVRYVYENGTFPPRSGHLVRGDRKFQLRDEDREREFELELEMFGFQRNGDIFTLAHPEAIGLFLDRQLAGDLAWRPGLALEGELARIARGGAGLPDVSLRCELLADDGESYRIGYALDAPGGAVGFTELADLVRNGRRYLGGGSRRAPARIAPELRRLIESIETVVRDLDESNRTFRLPYYAVEYFRHLAAAIPGALPELPRIASGETAAALTEFPFQGELRPYQSEGRDWLLRMTDHHFNVILADEMGLGKTVQLLAMLAARHQQGDLPALIIAPASLITNWEREANRFVPDLKVAAPINGGRAEIWDRYRSYDLIVISYAAARRDVTRLKKLRFSYLVLDEAQHIKNPGTANAQDCKMVPATHRVVLSGTPLENSPNDLWSIFDFLHPGMLGTFASFRKFYADIQLNPERRDDLAARVAPFIKRRTKAQVGTELPPKQEFTLYCDMDSDQRLLYDRVLAEGRRQLHGIEAGTGNAEIFTTLLRLRQICCHPGLLPPELKGADVPSTKMELFQELVEEHLDSGHKLLVFSQFTTLLARISDWLDREGIRYEYLDGATRDRQKRVDHFNRTPGIPVFLLSLKAGGTGLNLTSADTVVIFDPWWNPAAELQAADRTHRIGQTRPVSSLKLLVRDSIEEKMLQLQQRKRELFDSVIDNPNNYGEKLSIEDLKFLFES